MIRMIERYLKQKITKMHDVLCQIAILQRIRREISFKSIETAIPKSIEGKTVQEVISCQCGAWKAEIQSLQSEYDSIAKEQTKTATELAYAEVINYNKKNLERELQNESRQHNRQQSRAKRRWHCCFILILMTKMMNFYRNMVLAEMR